MTLNTFTLVWDVVDFLQSGVTAFLTLAPNTTITDSADGIEITNLSRTAPFIGGTGSLTGIVTVDNPQLSPSGWAYQVTITTAGGQVIFGPEYIQPSSADGATQNLASLVPAQSVVAMAPYLPIMYPNGAIDGYVWTTDEFGNGSWQPSTGGGGGGLTNPMTAPGDMIAGTTAGGPVRVAANTAAIRKFLRETGTGSAGTTPAWDTLQLGDIPSLSSLYDAAGAAAAAQAAAEAASVPLSGLPLSISNGGTGSTSASAARTALGLGTAATQASSAFDPAGAAATAQAAAEAASVPLADLPLSTGNGGTGNTSGIAVNISDTLDQVPTAAANVSLGSHKITNLANGLASSDAAAFGQIPTSLPPSGAAGGSLSGSYPNPGIASTAVTAGAYTYASLTVGADGRLTAASSGAAPLPLAGGTLTGALVPAVVTLTQSGGAVAVNAALANKFDLTLTASGWTISAPTNAANGQTIHFRLLQGSGGSFTISFASGAGGFDFGASGAPTLSTAVGAIDIVGFEYVTLNSLNKWVYLGSALGN